MGKAERTPIYAMQGRLPALGYLGDEARIYAQQKVESDKLRRILISPL
jgi:hypothetical protein